MQVVILAGGLGTRMRPVSKSIAKAMLEVAGRPFIDHQLELLKKNEMKRILLCVGHLGEQIEAYLGDGAKRGFDIQYSYEDPAALLGTGGALVNALPMLDGAFFVLYGDSYLPTDYGAVRKAFEERNVQAMMCVFRNEGKWDTSNVRVQGDHVSYYHKGANPEDVDYIDYGLSVYRRTTLEAFKDEEMPLDLATIQENLVGRGEMGAFVVHERFYQVGNPAGLAEFEEYLKSGIFNTP